jgi:hypothetical protein
MKKVGLFYYFIIPLFFYSCDSCNHKHEHKIKIEKGLITKDSTDIDPVDIIIGLKFNESNVFSFKNDDLVKYINSKDSVNVYRYFAKFPPNSLGNHKDSINGWFIELVNSKHILPDSNSLIGKYGCIPKFTVVNGNVLRTTDGSIPIIIAVHPNPSTSEPIPPTSDFFPINDDNYNLLNQKIKDDPSLEGGLDEAPTNGKMTIYKNRTQKVLCINTTGCP